MTGIVKKQPHDLLFLAFLFGLLILNSHDSLAGNLPADVLSELNSYNEMWTSPSTNGSPGSMPIGNGDITANWVDVPDSTATNQFSVPINPTSGSVFFRLVFP